VTADERQLHPPVRVTRSLPLPARLGLAAECLPLPLTARDSAASLPELMATTLIGTATAT